MTTTPNAPPIWYNWSEYVWAVFLVLVVIAECVNFFDPRFPTLTDFVKKWIPWGIVRAGIAGIIFYHFCIQPIVETLTKMGIKVY